MNKGSDTCMLYLIVFVTLIFFELFDVISLYYWVTGVKEQDMKGFRF